MAVPSFHVLAFGQSIGDSAPLLPQRFSSHANISKPPRRCSLPRCHWPKSLMRIAGWSIDRRGRDRTAGSDKHEDLLTWAKSGPSCVQGTAAMNQSDNDSEIVKDFLVESYENLDRLDRELVGLEKNPDDRDALAGVFRTIHTIKGTCG